MWPEPEPTEVLLSKARDGEADAVNELFDRHREAVRQLVQLRLDPVVRQRVDASDIVQEVLIEANRRLNVYLENPVMPFHLWLRQMAKDRMIDAYRRHRVAARRSLDREQPLVAALGNEQSTFNLAAQLQDNELTPAAHATWQELQRRFEAACEQLGDDDQEIVLMRHFEELSNQEVAEALGISAQAASMRYLRAIRRLREVLGEA